MYVWNILVVFGQNLKTKKNKSKCMTGSETGPNVQRDDKPIDEYYYMGKKFKLNWNNFLLNKL